jgi:putative nucleotidyltransferase with HDIG domain
MIHILQSPEAPVSHDVAAVPPADLVVHSLLDLMAARDPGLRAHSVAVSRLSVCMGEALGLRPLRVERLRRAALLHDVGKLALPDSVLQKPGPLTAPEYAAIRAHSRLGSQTTLALGLAREARWVLHHHERPDGRGYPDGLDEDAIPLEAAIIHVADAYDALTSDRPYRAALTRTKALRAITAGSGWQFDRDCVAALVTAACGERAAA